MGAFQRDRLSRCLFILVLAGALCELRSDLAVATGRPGPPTCSQGLPLDNEHADDVDFMDEEEENFRIILLMATDILKRWNLFFNEDKTNFTLCVLCCYRPARYARKTLSW